MPYCKMQVFLDFFLAKIEAIFHGKESSNSVHLGEFEVSVIFH